MPSKPRSGASSAVKKTNPRKERKRRELQELHELEQTVANFEGQPQEFGELPLSQATQQGLKYVLSRYYTSSRAENALADRLTTLA